MTLILLVTISFGMQGLLSPTKVLAQDRPPQGSSVLVSTDGENWSPQLPSHFLNDILNLSPGDHVTDTLWLRNNADVPLAIRVQLRWTGPEEPTDLEKVMTVGLEGQTSIAGQLRTQPLTVVLGEFAPQETTQVDLMADLPFSAGPSTESERIGLELAIQIRRNPQGGTDPTPTPTEPGTPSPTEPETPSPSESVTPSPSEPGTPTPTEPGTPTSTESAAPVPTEPGASTPSHPTDPGAPSPTAPTPPEPSAGSPDSTSRLAHTGANPWPLFIGSALAIGAGIFLVLAARRRRNTN